MFNIVVVNVQSDLSFPSCTVYLPYLEKQFSNLLKKLPSNVTQRSWSLLSSCNKRTQIKWGTPSLPLKKTVMKKSQQFPPYISLLLKSLSIIQEGFLVMLWNKHPSSYMRITSLYCEGDLVLVSIPLPVLEVHIEPKGLASSHDEFIASKKLCGMLDAILSTI